MVNTLGPLRVSDTSNAGGANTSCDVWRFRARNFGTKHISLGLSGGSGRMLIEVYKMGGWEMNGSPSTGLEHSPRGLRRSGSLDGAPT